MNAILERGTEASAELDLLACPLSGVNLIEASAGTGKTWNICGLYLRLLLERKLEVGQVLVVTFTKAATAELRERIRSRIVEALANLKRAEEVDIADGARPGDPFIVPLLAQLVAQGESVEDMRARLDLALQSFDEAAIYTIHSFCQRALADTPFAAGMPFTSELTQDEGTHRMAAINDFWRRRIGGADLEPELAAYLLNQKDSPEKFGLLLKRHVAKPNSTNIWPERGLLDSAALRSQLARLYGDARAIWLAHREAILAELNAALAQKLLKATPKEEDLMAGVAEWDALFAASAPPHVTSLHGRKMKLLAASALAGATRARMTPPTHPFFIAAESLLSEMPNLCKALDAELAGARLALIRQMLEETAQGLRRDKREKRICSFDDLLYNVHQALMGGDYPWLGAALRDRYPVALIDEFQDTDPLQFELFEKLYDSPDAAEDDTALFLVGDPKQAIYSFRNADLHTYLQAREVTQARYTLAGNQRASPALIDGLNAVFGANPGVFMLEGLQYQQVRSGGKRRREFVDRSEPRGDLQVWMLPAEGGEPIERGHAMHAAANATAAEIARLIQAGRDETIMLDQRALAPGDIAVLVRSHAQGSRIRRALAELNVASVEISQESVFASSDAADLECVLSAILEPGRAPLLLAAMATPLMGRSASDLAAMATDERQLYQLVERFTQYRETWVRRGAGFMYRQFLTEEQVSARLLRQDDGERRLTNLLHLGEQLQQAAQVLRAPQALLRWLQTARRENSGDETAQLRLESDQNLVQVLTIHKSKGLEYPVVFCPFLWDGFTRNNAGAPEGLEYHDAAHGNVIDFRADRATVDAAKKIIRQENAAESLRLIYVALTRAAHRCYVVAGPYSRRKKDGVSLKEGAQSLLNWMVAGAGQTPDQWFGEVMPVAELHAAWDNVVRAAEPAARLDALPMQHGVALRAQADMSLELVARTPPPPTSEAWRVSSFTGLMQSAHEARASADHDARVAPPVPQFPDETQNDLGDESPDPMQGDLMDDSPDLAGDLLDTFREAETGAEAALDDRRDILYFPRGADAGNCLHAAFERADFTDAASWPLAAERALKAFPQPVAKLGGGETANHVAMVAAMLSNVVGTRLQGDLSLNRLGKGRRLTELEFNFPAVHLRAAALNRVLAEAGYAVPPVAFRELDGYVKGFVDLVFEHEGSYYILDWKSNHLGMRRRDYAMAAIEDCMARNGYHLQYLLYALALHRYLSLRLPGYQYDQHFGGVFYLFVRGVRPTWQIEGKPAGVYFHKPAFSTIAALDLLVSGPAATRGQT
jgi:exodeoxyribonuclease V beta subunit